MKRPIGFVLILCFFAFGCKKKQHTLEETSYPSDFEIDINGDGTNDFIVTYKQLSTEDIPVSGSSINCTIRPENNVKVLYKTLENHLFLSSNDTIFQTANTSTEWSPYPAGIMRKSWSNKEGWDPSWSILSDLQDYYVAFKLNNGATNEFGWMHLQLDEYTGNLSVINSSSTALNHIIID